MDTHSAIAVDPTGSPPGLARGADIPIMPRRCKDCVMRSSGILAGVPQELFDRISCCMTLHRYPARHRLYVQGNPSGQVASIRSGIIKLSKQAENGKTQILGIVGPGFLLGHEAFQKRDWQSTAEALTEVQVCVAPIEAITRQLRDYPDIAIGLVVFLCQRIQELEGMALRLGTLSARQRLAAHLLAIHEAQTAGKLGTAGPLALSRQDLAEALGMAKETLIRMLAGLAEREIVGVDGTAITIRDAARLRRMLCATE